MRLDLGLNLGINQLNRAILDQLSVSSSAAYSLRKLRSAYTGSAIRVRRSSDNAEADIGFSGINLDTTALMSHVGGENLLVRSQEFNNTVWTTNFPGDTVSADSDVAPDGTTTADLITTISSSHNTQDIPGITTGQEVTASCYFKQGTVGTWVRLAVYSAATPSNQFRVWINTASGSLGTASATGTSTLLSSSIESVGNGWYRVSITGSIGGVSDYVFLTTNADANGATTRTAGQNRLQWGAQVNTGNLKPYQPTTTTARDGNGFVTAWYDQSGNARNVTQATGGSQPSIVKFGVLNEDADGNVFLDFDTKFMTGAVGLGTAQSIVAVYGKSVNGVNIYIFGSGKAGADTGINIFEDTNNKTNVTKAASRFSDSVDLSLNKKIIVGENTNDPPEYYKNGVQNILTSALPTSVEANLISIGTSGFPMQAKFYGGMIFANTLSTSDRQTLERNQGAYYGITVA
jgi:hypothetical protein